MRKLVSRRPSPALVVAFVALLVALGGTAYAFTVPNNSVGTKQLKNGAVTTKKIKNGAVTASKINPTGLTVPNALHANSANTAGNATTATNATQLGGIAASGYTRNDCSSLTGQIKGWALVSSSAGFSTTLTTSGVFGYNCSGGSVQARRIGAGNYEVVFANNPAIIAVGSSNLSTAGSDFDAVNFGHASGGDFRVSVYHIPTAALVDDPFDMILP
jgi:hypothetical protein